MSLISKKHNLKITQIILVMVAIHMLAIASFAQTGTSTSTVVKPTAPTSAFSLSLGLEYSEKIAEDELGERENGSDLTIAPSYKINDLATASLKTAVSKSNNGAGDTTISDTQVGLSIKGFKLNETTKSVHSISVVIPTSETSQDRDKLTTGIGFTNGVSFQEGITKITYRIGLSKNFHEFTVNALGSPNIEYRIANLLDVQVNLTDTIYLTANGVYRYGRTYGGKERTSFEAHGDINYDASSKVTLNLGTSNVGSALKSNGVDSNISAYDEDTSVVRAGVSLSL